MPFERRPLQPIFCCSALLALAAISLSSSVAGELYGGGSRSKSLYSINLESGVRTTVSLTGHVNDVNAATGRFKTAAVNGLAYNSSDGYLYATTRIDSPPPSPSGSYPDELSIFRIDPRTYDVQRFQITQLPVTSPPVQRTLSGFEYDSRRNVFWATSVTGASQPHLIRIDAQTFEAKVVGYFSSPQRDVSGLAYDRLTDTLYGVDDGFLHNGTRLFAINGASLSGSSPISSIPTTEIGPIGLGLGLGDVDSLAFDPVRRRLYGIDDAQFQSDSQKFGQLVSIDPATGMAMALGTAAGTLEYYQGLAFIPPPPLDLDGSDFLAWQRGAGISANASFADGDFSGDGKVDGEDLDLWKYSMTYGNADSPAVSVPECFTITPLFMASLAVVRSCRGVGRDALAPQA